MKNSKKHGRITFRFCITTSTCILLALQKCGIFQNFRKRDRFLVSVHYVTCIAGGCRELPMYIVQVYHGYTSNAVAVHIAVLAWAFHSQVRRDRDGTTRYIVPTCSVYTTGILFVVVNYDRKCTMSYISAMYILL